MVITDGKATTVAVSDPLVEHLGRLQVDSREGPCIDAAEKMLTRAFVSESPGRRGGGGGI